MLVAGHPVGRSAHAALVLAQDEVGALVVQRGLLPYLARSEVRPLRLVLRPLRQLLLD